MGWSRWNHYRYQRPLSGVVGHRSPRNPIVIASGDSVAVGEGPMGVKLVVLAIANRFVTRHRHRIARKLLKVHLRPIEVIFHRRVRLLVERHAHVKVRALEDDVVPRGRLAPFEFESSSLSVRLFVPARTEGWV